MAVRSSRSLALASGVLALSLTQGCVDDGVSLHVICPIVPMVSDMGCTWDPESGMCTPQGLLNLGSAPAYRFVLMVESGLKPRNRDVPPLAEPNGIQIETARVELRLATGERLDFGAAVANPATVPATGFINPASRGAVTVDVVSLEQINVLATKSYTELVAAIKIKGRTNGNDIVESSEFLWPIHLQNTSHDKASNMCSTALVPCVGFQGQDEFADVCF